jgi:regulator of protease activity HflC (stomatin/prohibitin superfamily)
MNLEMLQAAGIAFAALFIGMPVLRTIARAFGLYTTVTERTCRVYVLFGKVAGVLDEPGLHILPFKSSWD